jgi:hypothetical protein
MPRAEITFGPGVRVVGPKPRRLRLRKQAEPPLSLEALAALDRELVRVAGGAGGHRLRVGEALNELSRRGWHHQLGFSSLSAYVQERCNQPARWGVECCALARRLENLPVLRAALVSAKLGWSKVELVARRATPETESVSKNRSVGPVHPLTNLNSQHAGGADEHCSTGHSDKSVAPQLTWQGTLIQPAAGS